MNIYNERAVAKSEITFCTRARPVLTPNAPFPFFVICFRRSRACRGVW